MCMIVTVQEHTDLLFFLFYCCQGDALQLVAASLLFERGWRYHKQAGPSHKGKVQKVLEPSVAEPEPEPEPPEPYHFDPRTGTVSLL